MGSSWRLVLFWLAVACLLIVALLLLRGVLLPSYRDPTMRSVFVLIDRRGEA